MNRSHQVHQDHESHGDQDHKKSEEPKRPYWKRVHHDWKFWIMVSLMIVLMMFYVLSDDFALIYRGG